MPIRIFPILTARRTTPTTSLNGSYLPTGEQFRQRILSGSFRTESSRKRKLAEFKSPSPSPSDALPGVAEVQRAFDRLHDMANENARKGNGHYLGRRLYIYMSGHGFAPSDQDQEAGVYTANVTRDRAGYHILGRYNADWFVRAACFDEVLLFMDCCRTLDPVEALNKPYAWVRNPDALDRVKCLYGFATQWSKSTRERKFHGVARGVFTTALLEGLKTATAGPDAKITTNSLYNYLSEHMKELWHPKIGTIRACRMNLTYTPTRNAAKAS